MKKNAIILLILFLSVYLAWPYVTLWQLEQAAVQADLREFAKLVDLPAVRKSIKRRLNKDLGEINNDVSAAFIDWLQDGLHRLGSMAIEQLVTLDWVRQQVLSKTESNTSPGLLRYVKYAFFASPDAFLVRVGTIDQDPVYLHLGLTTGGWRLIAVYN